MNKRAVGFISVSVLLLAIIGGVTGKSQPSKLSNAKSANSTHSKRASSRTANSQTKSKAKPICDGTNVTADCVVDGVNYSTYVYHPAVPEKTHTETVTTYQRKVTGYCTLCNDGTYSPSCATGRGACSWHGGVQEWNAPEYENIPVSTTNTIVDAPAQAAYYEKVVQ